ncbi:sigma-70 family RNA polymerase sigma factor [Pseudonocardia sp. KRD291]|uniref:sigma-70 family RNA polymerase sigma factor n=1 Tax=Pseudonocardia sp. KRD291 TaxID=2792007 RepID=UPI001CF7B3A0|nr:sigma-70 family RNA polymerase sigma factor [Pseudonocardia sp. KRD291]
MDKRSPAVLDGPVDLRRESDLEAAYRAHGAELHRFAARALRDEGAAGDVVQEVFVRAWRNAERYDPSIASMRVWLFGIARNAVIDHVRRARSRPGDRSPTDPGDLADLAEGRDAGRAGDAFSDDLVTTWLLEDALGRLGPEQRSAVVETYLRGRPYAEVATEQSVAVGTLRSRVFYGLKNLRQIMDDMGAVL